MKLLPSTKSISSCSVKRIADDNKQPTSYSMKAIGSCLKDKNSMSPLSKSKFIHHMDDSVKYYHKNMINELKSMFEKSKIIHMNNNSFDHENDDYNSTMEINTKKIVTSDRSTIEVIISKSRFELEKMDIY